MNNSERDDRISEICRAFEGQLQNGGDHDYSKWLIDNDDLQPELSDRLDAVLADWLAANVDSEKVEGDQSEPVDEALDSERLVIQPTASIRDSSDLNPTVDSADANRLPGGRPAQRIQCPHCGIALQLVQNSAAEVTCRGCGSSITVDGNRERTVGRPTEQVIGRFTLMSILGEGSFGTVYKARDRSTNRSVAIKIPREGYFESSSQRQRFFREAQNSGTLEHDNIVRVYEVDQASDGTPFIVSQLIDGMTLADFSHSRQLDYRQSAEIMIGVCDAVDFAHSRNIIHRDLKPSNILLNRDLRPYVTDFGLAKVSEDEMTLTIDGEVLGTPAYMSPEQAAGANKQLKGTSDVYSLGVVLYRLLTGSLPFRGSQRMLIHQVLTDDPKPLRSFNDEIPRDLETITLKAMEKDAAKRYESAAALGEDLRRWLNGEPIIARPISSFDKFVRWCRRKPVVASLVGSVFGLLLVAGLLAALWGNEQFKRAEALEQSSQRLVRTYENEGQNLLGQDEWLSAITWFSEAWYVDPADDLRHRLRLEMILSQCPTLSQLFTVDAAVTALTISENGQLIAVGDSNGGVSIFDFANGTQINKLDDHQTRIRNLRFVSNDSRLISQAINDNHLVLWNVTNGQKITRLEHGGSVRDFVVNVGDDFAYSVAWDGTTIVWSTNDGSKIKDLPIEGRHFLKAGLTPDRKTAAAVSISVGEEEGQSLRYWVSAWDVDTGELNFEKQLDKVSHILFDLSSEELVIGLTDGQIQFVNPESGDESRPAMQTSGELLDLSYLDQGRQLLTISEDGIQTIWKLSPNTEKRFTQDLVEGNIKQSLFDKDERLIVSVRDDGLTQVRLLERDSLVCCYLPNDDRGTQIALHPNGRFILIGNRSGVIRIWDLASTRVGKTDLIHDGDLNGIAFSPDGGRVVTFSRDQTARLWNSGDGTIIGDPMKHENSVFHAEFNSDGSRLITGSSDSTVNVWNGATAARIGEKIQLKSPVVHVSFHPSSNQFVSCTDNGEIEVWNADTGESVFKTNYESRVYQIFYSPNGKYIVAGFKDGTLISIELESGKISKQQTHGGKTINTIRFLPDGSTFVSGGNDGSIRIWNVEDLAEISEPLIHLSAVSGLDVRNDGAIVSVDTSGRICFWEQSGASWERRWEERVQGSILNDVVFHQNPRFIAISGMATGLENDSFGKGFALVFDTESRSPLSPHLKHFHSISAIEFNPNGDRLATASYDDSATIWRIENYPLPVEHLRNLGTLYTSKQFDGNDRLVGMPASELKSLFLKESEKYPNSFRSNQESEADWNAWLNRVASVENAED